MLTDAKLRTLKHRETRYRVTDSADLAVEVPVNGAPRWRFDELRAAQWWADYLDSLRAGGKVVAFKPQEGSAA